jgi:hypothetical protein
MRGSLDARLRRVSQAAALAAPPRYRVIRADEFLAPLPEYQERRAEIERLDAEYRACLGGSHQPTPPERLAEAGSIRQALLSAMRELCQWGRDRMAELDGETLHLEWDEVLIKVIPALPGDSRDGR